MPPPAPRHASLTCARSTRLALYLLASLIALSIVSSLRSLPAAALIRAPPAPQSAPPPAARLDDRPAQRQVAAGPFLPQPGPWAAGVLFHTIDNGQRMRGAVLVHKDASAFQFKDWTVVERCNGRTCAMRAPRGCLWCPGSGGSAGGAAAECIPGVLTGGKSRAEQYFELVHGNRKWASARSYSTDASKALYLTVLLTCDLSPRASGGGPGVLSLDGLPGLWLTVAPLPAARPAARAEDVVCARGLFGRVDGRAVARAVHHYTALWNFSRVVVYQMGMDDLRVGEDPDVRAQLREGSLVVVDVRDELQRVYGGSALATDALLFSFSMGQILFKFDCLVRAQTLGARWTLHVDLDELAVPGRARVEASGASLPTTSFAEFAAARPDASWISFGALSAAGSEPCGCEPLADWPRVLREAADRHAREEWPAAAPREPFDCFAKPPVLASLCAGVAGFRKFALRVDRGPVLPVGMGVHDVLECSVACADTNNGWVVDAKDVYLRHYRCLNLPFTACGRAAGAPLFSPAQAAVVGSVQPLRSRGVVLNATAAEAGLL